MKYQVYLLLGLEGGSSYIMNPEFPDSFWLCSVKFFKKMRFFLVSSCDQFLVELEALKCRL